MCFLKQLVKQCSKSWTRPDLVPLGGLKVGPRPNGRDTTDLNSIQEEKLKVGSVPKPAQFIQTFPWNTGLSSQASIPWKGDRNWTGICCANVAYHGETRRSAIAAGLCDASCQLKSCQLPRNSAELLVRQVLNKSKLWSWRVTVGRYVINMCTQPWCDRVASIVL